MARLSASDRLLLRLPSWLGDFVMAEPALAALEGALQAGRLRRLGLVAPERFFDLIEGRFEGAQRLGPDDAWDEFDTALFLDGSLGSVLQAWRAGIGRRFGWTHGGRGLLLRAGFRPALEDGGVPLGLGCKGRGARRLPRPFGAACNELVGYFGEAVTDRAPHLRAAHAPREAVATRLQELGVQRGQPYFVLDASARPGSAKGAPAELWARALQSAQLGSLPSLVILAAPGEARLARELHGQLQGPNVHLFDAPPPSMGELLAVIEGAALFVGPDSGPRHLATATGRPQLILLGPSDPRHTADHNRATEILRVEVPCGPCHREQCPLPGSARGRCMSEIDAGRIATALGRALR